MAKVLELSDGEFKANMMNILRAFMNKVDCMQEQMGNVSRDMEILRKNQKELEIKNTAREMKNAIDRYISGPDTAEERISRLGVIFIGISKTDKQRNED